MLSAVVLTTLAAASAVPPEGPPAAPAPAAAAPAPTAAAPAPVADPPLAWNLEPARRLTLQLPGMSHHFDKPTDSQGRTWRYRRYNERNWGIGLQFEEVMGADTPSPWIMKSSFGLMRDSLDAMGLYAGRTFQRRLADSPRHSVDLGVGAFLFYRTLRFDGPHVLVPALLPAVSLQHKPTGFGVNLVALPRVKYGSGQMPGVVYAQFTKAL